jgi:mono/diheme cytochrome c family protein
MAMSEYFPALRALALPALAAGLLVACQRAAPPAPAAPEPPPDPIALLKKEGRDLFNTRCIVCHQPDGRGLPGTYPPLNGSPWLLDADSKERCTKILLYGLAGRVTVGGQTFDAEMPNFKLTDRQVAAALTYVRSAWSNNAPPVEESFVAAVRARCGNRGPWTPYELLAQHPVDAE